MKFDEAHEKVVSAKATGYKSEWPGGWMEIDKDNNVYDDTEWSTWKGNWRKDFAVIWKP